MKKAIKRLKPIDDEKECRNAIVETPKNSRVKYSYDEDTGLFQLSKAMPEGMVFPFNFGFIPQTLAEDGDPLDVLILNEEPLVTGCLLKVRPVAVIKATQSEKNKTVRNDRILAEAIPKETPLEFASIKVSKKLLSDIEVFFVTYNQLYGKKFKVLEHGGSHPAWKIIHKAIELRQKKQKEDE